MPSVGMQNAGPMGQLAGAVQGAPAGAVKGIASSAEPLMKMAEQSARDAAEIADINRAVGSVDPSKQSGYRALLMSAKLGANLPAQVQQQLFPELFPQDGSVDPQVINAGTALFKTGVFSWGQVRRQLGIPKMDGIPDDVKYVAPTLKFERRPTEQQNKASAQLQLMQSTVPIIDAYSIDQAPGVVSSYLLNSKPGGVQELFANSLISDKDRQFVSATRQFGDAWVRAVSGAQTNEQEFARILRASFEMAGDDPNTRQQKRNMRAQMVQAVADIAAGTNSRTQVMDRLLGLNWSKEQRKMLEDYKKRAARYEADIKAGKVQVDATSPAPGNANELQEQLDEIRAALSQMPREP
jgi:hypothetical protein